MATEPSLGQPHDTDVFVSVEEAARLAGVADGERTGVMNAITVEAQSWLAHDPKLRHLTDRQQEVVSRLAEGRTPAQVAVELGIGFLTVKNHLADIRRRMHIAGIKPE